MTALMVNLSGLMLMAGIVWWFWLYRPAPAVQPDTGAVQIIVENGVYTPDRISIPANQPTTLRFLRKDRSSCAATVIFDNLDISAELPFDEFKEIIITPTTPGHYTFGCQMRMYRGTLDVSAR
ncbi:cupredoxin domain-containing protein [Motiliproteus sp. MSK22-1]|uniref:cupredoxin domain-containing protein n=1 Tax=Motiliproteus sp. MSK22-1 TaxID=1897630 RepID=UPI000976804E|nr:cupredoxin domain-containing protein [Motiliproteus sp. MSK22-1]OMH31774.1 plastocyanin [Motiliproteus sp. MSK22-1]